MSETVVILSPGAAPLTLSGGAGAAEPVQLVVFESKPGTPSEPFILLERVSAPVLICPVSPGSLILDETRSVTTLLALGFGRSAVEGGSGGGDAVWGTITGTLSDQTDLNSALGTKLNASAVSAFGLTLVDDANAATARTTLGLGTAATAAASSFATSAQGSLADSAVQPGDNVSTLTNDSGFISGVAWGSISGTLSSQTDLNSALGAKLNSSAVSAFGGTLIDDADAGTARSTLGLGTAATAAASSFATSAQGALADSATQPGDNISTLTNNSGFITGVAWGAITGTLSNQTDLSSALGAKLNVSAVSVFGLSLIDDADTATARTTLGLGTASTEASTAFATSAQGALADSATQPGDNVSTLTNDSGFISGVAWGSISGTLSSQTDLNSALGAKLNSSAVSAFGGTLIDDADAATARTTLGLGTAAVAATGDFAAAAHTHTESQITDLDHDAVKLQGRTLAATLPANGQALIWNNGAAQWEPSTIPGATTSAPSNAPTSFAVSSSQSLSTTVISGETIEITTPARIVEVSWAYTQGAVEADGFEVSMDDGAFVEKTLVGRDARSAVFSVPNTSSFSASVRAFRAGETGFAYSSAASLLASISDSFASINVKDATKLQARSVASGAPSNGQALVWNSGASQWEPQTVSGSGGGTAWSEVTGTSQAAAVNSGYVANNAGLVTVTLPATCAVGDLVRVVGKGAGKWKLTANTGQTVQGPYKATTSGGSINGRERYSTVEVVCINANATWAVASFAGMLDFS